MIYRLHQYDVVSNFEKILQINRIKMEKDKKGRLLLGSQVIFASSQSLEDSEPNKNEHAEADGGFIKNQIVILM